MKSQKALVDVIGKFTPKIVKMDGAKHKNWGKKNREEIAGE
jgi:tRNA-splicing ligase RtcB